MVKRMSIFNDLRIPRNLVISFLLFSPLFVSANTERLKHGWSFTFNLDKMTDQNRSLFFKESDRGVFFFKCFGNGWYEPAWVVGKYFTSSSTFMYRFDKDAPVSVDSGQMASNNRILFLDEQKGFVERALKANVVIFQARDRDGDVVTQEFNLNGLKDALGHANRVAPCR